MNKKPILVAFSWEAPWIATCALRIREFFASKGFKVVNGCVFNPLTGSVVGVNDQIVNCLEMADLVVFQRFILIFDKFVKSICKISKNSNKKIIYDLDDNIFWVPDYIPSKEILLKTAENFIKLHDLFDKITVSTEYLKKEVEKAIGKQENVEIVPTVLPHRLKNKMRNIAINLQASNWDTYPIKVVFQGTPTHKKDIKIIKEPVLKIKSEFREKVKFISFGLHVDFFDDYLPFCRSYYEFCKVLPSLGAKIGLGPLLDNPFNRAKSDIKRQEYDACLIQGLLSKVYPSGTLSEDPEEWYISIRENIEYFMESTSFLEEHYEM